MDAIGGTRACAALPRQPERTPEMGKGKHPVLPQSAASVIEGDGMELDNPGIRRDLTPGLYEISKSSSPRSKNEFSEIDNFSHHLSQL